MLKNKCVLLLKTQSSDGAVDKYEELLTANGFEVSQVKTLEFEFKNINILEEKLSNSNEYAGIILSSPRCVHAVHLAVNKKSVIDTWREKHNFVVGEATYSDAVKKLFLECKGKESGNSANLSKLILTDKEMYSKPFLFPHGNLKTDTLKLELGKEGLEIEGVLVYDTIANANIEKEIAEVTHNFTSIPEYLVFFSPSGFRSSINHLVKIPMDLKNVKFIAIGPVTELAIKEANYKVHGVTKNPTPQDVLDVILNDC